MERQDIEKELYRQERLPVFQNRMYDSEADAKACPRGDIVLVENRTTGLVYNSAFRPELVTYDGSYQNEQAISAVFQEHLETVASIVGDGMGRKALVEVGCGKGYFLELLLGKGFEVTGFDPAYEGDNEHVHRRYFEPGIDIEASGLILRHVLEHVPNPYQFLSLLKEANGGRGKIYIEVPCFDWICERRGWFDIYYEHVNYFRLSDFHRMFGVVFDSGRVFGDQYLYVVADLSSLRMPELTPGESLSFPDDFTAGLENAGGDEGSRAAVWGGASKGVIFSLIRERSGRPIDRVIDVNPAKQNKYLPATGLMVKSPQEGLRDMPEGATIYVMNSMYLDEIIEMSGNKYNYVGIDHE